MIGWPAIFVIFTCLMYVLHTLNVHTALPVFSNLDSYSVTVTPHLRSPLKNGVEVGAWGGVFVSDLLPSVISSLP